MRRLFLYLIVAMLVFGTLRAMRHHAARPIPPATQWPHRPGLREDEARRQRELAEVRRQAHEATAEARRHAHEATAEARRHAHEVVAEARRAMDEARQDVRQAWHEVRDELNRAYRETRDEIRQAYREAVAEQDRRPVLPPPPPPTPAVAPAREVADGLPVPIVPGTRVTEAEARPPVPARTVSRAAQPAPPAPPVAPAAPAAASPQDLEDVPGEICATEDRARADARRALQVRVGRWLEPDVPPTWTPPAALVQSLVVGSRIDPHFSKVEKDDGPLYIAVLTADLSPGRRAKLVDTYTHDLVRRRLLGLGTLLSFVLICLAAISGYIRADEATKGYYTNRLRLLAAAGVGAAGVIVYRMMIV
jgi:hypothetical protein